MYGSHEPDVWEKQPKTVNSETYYRTLPDFKQRKNFPGLQAKRSNLQGQKNYIGIRIFQKAICKARQQWSSIFQKFSERKCESRILYLAKVPSSISTIEKQS